jgi:hypothetical protein
MPDAIPEIIYAKSPGDIPEIIHAESHFDVWRFRPLTAILKPLPFDFGRVFTDSVSAMRAAMQRRVCSAHQRIQSNFFHEEPSDESR